MINKIGVIGAGSMGAAIAETFAYNGYEVVLKDQNKELTEKGMKSIERILDDFISYTTRTPEKEIQRIEKIGVILTNEQKDVIRKNLKTGIKKEDIIAKIHPSETYDDMRELDFVIEAIFENQSVKNKLFEELSGKLSESTILASNTSSLSVTEMAAHYRYPEKVITAHFFNPPYTLPLVEVVPTIQTSEDTIKDTFSLLQSMKNHRESIVPVKAKERAGFVVNRILIPMINEAMKVVDEGIADVKTVDIAMKKGAGMPMGPFELSDYVGVDIVYHVLESFREAFGDEYLPPETMKQMIAAGYNGRKSKRGFYTY